MVVTDGDRVNTQVAGQLVQDDLSLDPELGGRALYAQRQDMMAAAGKSIPRGPQSPGTAPAPDLSDVPAQAQGVDDLERIPGPRHAPPLYGGKEHCPSIRAGAVVSAALAGRRKPVGGSAGHGFPDQLGDIDDEIRSGPG
jgi:hypothetical protein